MSVTVEELGKHLSNEQVSSRAYIFGNMYLSSIQQGIQAVHVITEMFVKYSDHFDNSHNLHVQYDQLYSWARHDKTIILLNGGSYSNIYELTHFLYSQNNTFPWAYFCEDEYSLNNMMTSVGIVLPAYFCKKIDSYRMFNGIYDDITTFKSTWEQLLAERIAKLGLAR